MAVDVPPYCPQLGAYVCGDNLTQLRSWSPEDIVFGAKACIMLQANVSISKSLLASHSHVLASGAAFGASAHAARSSRLTTAADPQKLTIHICMQLLASALTRCSAATPTWTGRCALVPCELLQARRRPSRLVRWNAAVLQSSDTDFSNDTPVHYMKI